MPEADYYKPKTGPGKTCLSIYFTILIIPFMIFMPAPVSAQGQPLSLCPVSTDIPARPLVTEPLDLNDIFITADDVDYIEGGTSKITGNAELKHNDQQVSADRVEFNDPENSVLLTGEVNYWDNDIYLNSPGGSIDLDTDTGDFSDVQYWLYANRGRGHADHAMINLGTRTEGQRVDFTTCDPDLDSPWNLTTNIWKLRASRLVLNHETERGSGTNVILKVKDIPVFYLPYISFPLSDRRKSGFLVPTFLSSSRYGLEIQTPYYWNISPQMDATITPRVITKSGLMMTGEYRYLFRRGSGTLNLEYLPSDSVYDDRDRNSIAFKHTQSFWNYGALSIDYNRVSDDDYLEDFSNSLIGTGIQYLNQSAVLSNTWYFKGGHSLNVYNLVGNYQTIDPNIPIALRPYKRLPSTTVSYSSPYINRQLYYNVAGKVDNFQRDFNAAAPNINGIRYDLYPSITYPISELSYYLNPKLGIRYTGYQLNEDAVLADKTPDRFLPILSVDSGLFFERNTDLLGEAVLQTLEPRIYYLYIPEHEQADLPVFDTGHHSLNFASIFYDNRFSGIDRQGDANQISLALTSRVYNSTSGQHLGSVSLGQVVYLGDRKVGLPGYPVQTRTVSPIIAYFESGFFPNLNLSAEYQLDPYELTTEKLAFSAQYRPSANKVINIGYRRQNANADPNIPFKLNQTDISFKWPLRPGINLVGKWNFAIEGTRTLDLFGGVEYNSCCWSVRLLGRRFLSNLSGDIATTLSREYDTGFFIQIELKGLAGMGEKTVDFLRMAIPGYRSDF